MKAIVTIGVSASGKTTWAKQYAKESISHTMVISRDDIRREILELRHKRRLEPGELWKMWKWKDEDLVTAKFQEQVAVAHRNGFDLVIADTNLVEKYRVLTVKRLEDLGYEVELKLFPVTFEEAVKRDNGRADGVGASVIWKQFKQYHDTIGTQKYVRDTTLDKVIIFDVDGTLAIMKDRGPFDWDKVGQDEVNEDVAAMFRAYKAMGYRMIVMSGRDGVCRPETYDWLEKNDLHPFVLLMRKAGDIRRDSEIKRELFFKYVAPYYNVCGVVDDRKQMIREWQLIGLTVFNVGDAHEEF
jgi:adenylate kinase family enzyme